MTMLMKYAVILLIGMTPMIPALIYFQRKRKDQLVNATRGLFIGLGSANVLIGLMAFALGIIWLMTPEKVQAAGLLQTANTDNYRSFAAALSTGIAAISSGYAVSTTGAAALGTITEKPELFGQALIFVGLAEGIAIYGLLISFLILNQ